MTPWKTSVQRGRKTYCTIGGEGTNGSFPAGSVRDARAVAECRSAPPSRCALACIDTTGIVHGARPVSATAVAVRFGASHRPGVMACGCSAACGAVARLIGAPRLVAAHGCAAPVTLRADARAGAELVASAGERSGAAGGATLDRCWALLTVGQLPARAGPAPAGFAHAGHAPVLNRNVTGCGACAAVRRRRRRAADHQHRKRQQTRDRAPPRALRRHESQRV